MKNIVLSAIAVFAMSSIVVAGEGIAPQEELTIATPAAAKEYAGAYIGIAYSFIDSPISNFNTFPDGTHILPSLDIDLSTGGFMINFGYRFNAYVAVEGRYWGGGNDNGEIDVNGINLGHIDIDLDAWGIYVKPMYPVSEVFDVYALLGYGSATFEHNNQYNNVSYSESLDTSGFSLGLGGAYSFGENISVFADYVIVAYENLANPDGLTDTKYQFNTFNIGVAYKY